MYTAVSLPCRFASFYYYYYTFCSLSVIPFFTSRWTFVLQQMLLFFSFLFLCFSLLWLNYFQQNKSALCEFFPQQNFASRVFIVLLPYFNLFVRFICCCLIIPLFIICIPFLFINLFLSLFLSYLYMLFLLPS